MKTILVLIVSVVLFCGHAQTSNVFLSKYTYIIAPIIPSTFLLSNNKISGDSSNFTTLLEIDTINLRKDQKIFFISNLTVTSNERFIYIVVDSVRKTNLNEFSVNGSSKGLIDKKKKIIYMIKEKKAYYISDIHKNNKLITNITKNDSIYILLFQKGKDSIQLVLNKDIPNIVTGLLYIPEEHMGIRSFCSNYVKWNLIKYKKIESFDFKSIYKNAKKKCVLLKDVEFDLLFGKEISKVNR